MRIVACRALLVSILITLLSLSLIIGLARKKTEQVEILRLLRLEKQVQERIVNLLQKPIANGVLQHISMTTQMHRLNLIESLAASDQVHGIQRLEYRLHDPVRIPVDAAEHRLQPDTAQNMGETQSVVAMDSNPDSSNPDTLVVLFRLALDVDILATNGSAFLRLIGFLDKRITPWPADYRACRLERRPEPYGLLIHCVLDIYLWSAVE